MLFMLPAPAPLTDLDCTSRPPVNISSYPASQVSATGLPSAEEQGGGGPTNATRPIHPLNKGGGGVNSASTGLNSGE